jgi:pimeloyl-ACP methyl ester carboxylesterase
MPTVQRPEKSTNGRSPAPWPLRAGLSALGAVSPALAGRAGARLFLTPPRHRAPAREGAALAAAEPFALRHRGRALRGWSLGAGPAVLLVHGWGGRSGQLAGLARSLAAAGCTAVGFDAPAHGASGGRTTSMVGIAEAATAVAGRFEARAAIGHSVGGAAIAFAASRGLELAAAALVAPPRTPWAFVDELAHELRLSPAVRAALEDGLVRRIGLAHDAVDVARCAPPTPPPMLVVHDDGDADVPLAAGEDVARAWRARLVVTSGLGHRRILRDGAVVQEVVGFVTAKLPRCACGRLAEGTGGDGVTRCGGCALAEDLWARDRRRAAIGPPSDVRLPGVTI